MEIKANFGKLRRERKNIIKQGPMALICGPQGIKIFWDNYEITSGVGLNVAINTLGMWMDSSKADWQIEETGVDYFKIKITFKDMPLSQSWTIKIKRECQIHWEVEAEVEQQLFIDEFRILSMIHPRYKSGVHNYYQIYFSRICKSWVEFNVDDSPAFLVGARFFTEGKFLPSISMEPRDDNNNFFSVIQNTPIDLNAHIIGVKKILPENKKDYFPGHYSFFSGIINIYGEDNLFDEKIERLRQNYLDAAMTGKIKKYEIKNII